MTPKSVGQQRRIEIDDDRSAVVVVRPEEKQVEIERNGTRWIFRVDRDHHAELVETYDDGPTVQAELPEWIETVLDEIGVEGIDA